MARLEFQFRTLERWPRPETPAVERKHNATFRSGLPATLKLLAHELHAVGAINPVLVTTAHSDKHVRIDGLPRADVPAPRFPGVIIEFAARPGHLMFACDSCRRWEHNLHAIALTMEWLRAVDRYGAAGGDAQYAGFKALPPPGAGQMTAEQAAAFVASESQLKITGAELLSDHVRYRDAYRRTAARLHPDKRDTHDPEKWAKLQQADAIIEAVRRG